jgi:hypothetical protein
VHRCAHGRPQAARREGADRPVPLGVGLLDAEGVLSEGPSADARADGEAVEVVGHVGRHPDRRHHHHRRRVVLVDEPQADDLVVQEGGRALGDGVDDVLERCPGRDLALDPGQPVREELALAQGGQQLLVLGGPAALLLDRVREALLDPAVLLHVDHQQPHPEQHEGEQDRRQQGDDRHVLAPALDAEHDEDSRRHQHGGADGGQPDQAGGRSGGRHGGGDPHRRGVEEGGAEEHERAAVEDRGGVAEVEGPLQGGHRVDEVGGQLGRDPGREEAIAHRRNPALHEQPDHGTEEEDVDEGVRDGDDLRRPGQRLVLQVGRDAEHPHQHAEAHADDEAVEHVDAAVGVAPQPDHPREGEEEGGVAGEEEPVGDGRVAELEVPRQLCGVPEDVGRDEEHRSGQEQPAGLPGVGGAAHGDGARPDRGHDEGDQQPAAVRLAQGGDERAGRGAGGEEPA